MYVELTYDESTPLDVQEILGKISLSKGNQTIEEDNTYLDSWLTALIKGLHKIENEEKVSIDLVEEPTPLEMEWVRGFIVIKYKTQQIVLEGIEELKEALKESAQSMISKFRKDEYFSDNNLLKQISDFAIS